MNPIESEALLREALGWIAHYAQVNSTRKWEPLYQVRNLRERLEAVRISATNALARAAAPDEPQATEGRTTT